MTLDSTTFLPAFKRLYTKQRLEMMVYQSNPLLAMLSKMEEFGGEQMPIPIIYANPQGRNRTFATAQTASTTTSSKLAAFGLTRVSDYGIATITNEIIEASKTDAMAFMRALKTENDGILNSLIRSAAVSLFRTGYGELGTIGSFTGSTITMKFRDEIANVEIGQVHMFAADVGTSAARAGTLTVTGVDRSTGIITYSSAVSGVTSIANNDIIFVSGDRDTGASPARGKIAGCEAWFGGTAPTSTAFFGVDRSVDTRLGGNRIDATGQPIDEILIEGITRCSREGGSPDKAFMSYTTWSALEKALGTKARYVDLDLDDDGVIGWRALRVMGPKGPVDCVADQNCPPNRVFIVELASLELCSLGKLPRVLNMDGLESLRQATADGVEIRWGYYANLSCNAPGYNLCLYSTSSIG